MATSTPQSGKGGQLDFERLNFERPGFQPPEIGHGDSAESRDLVLLGGFCLFLSALDHLIPKPLPFMRIGLANLPLLIALGIFSAKNFFLLALIKVLGQGLITGTLFSYVALFSLTGTALSAALMFVLYRAFPKNILFIAGAEKSRTPCKDISLIGIGIAGAFVSNAAQLVLARFIVFGEGVLYLAPPFLAAGIISGGVLGFFAETFSAQSEWLRLKREWAAGAEPAGAEPAGAMSAAVPANTAPAATYSEHAAAPPDTAYPAVPVEEKASSGQNVFSFRSIALLLPALFFLFIPWLPVRAALFALFWLLALVAGKRTRPVFTIISIMMITACNLFPPFGKILFHTGPFIIAEGSLTRGLQRAVTMEGLIMFSRLAASAFPLPGTLGRLLRETFGVLERLNLSAGGSNPTGRKEKTGSLPQKLDRLLCEMSGLKNSLEKD